MEAQDHAETVRYGKMPKEPDTSNAMIYVAATCIEFSRDLVTLCRAAGGQLERGASTPQARYLYQYWRRQEIPKEEVLKGCQDGKEWVLGELVAQKLKMGCRQKGAVLSQAIAAIRVYVAHHYKNLEGAFDLSTDAGWAAYKKRTQRFEAASSVELGCLPEALKNYEPGQNDLADWLKVQPPEIIANLLEVFTLSIAIHPDPRLEIQHLEPGTEKQFLQPLSQTESEMDDLEPGENGDGYNTTKPKAFKKTPGKLPGFSKTQKVRALLAVAMIFISVMGSGWRYGARDLFAIMDARGPLAALEAIVSLDSEHEIYQASFAYFKAGFYKEAQELGDRLTRSESDLSRARGWYYVGIVENQQGRYLEGEQALIMAAKFYASANSKEGIYRTKIEMANSIRGREEFNKAHDLLAEISQAENSFDFITTKINIYIESSNFEAAQKELWKAINQFNEKSKLAELQNSLCFVEAISGSPIKAFGHSIEARQNLDGTYQEADEMHYKIGLYAISVANGSPHVELKTSILEWIEENQNEQAKRLMDLLKGYSTKY